MEAIAFLPPLWLSLSLLQALISSTALAFTKAGSPLRWVALGINIYLTYLVNVVAYTPGLAFAIIVFPIHWGPAHTSAFLARAIIERWEFQPALDKDGKAKPGRSNSAWDRLKTCALVLFSPRAVNLRVPGVNETKNVPKFSPDGSIPSRTSLLVSYTLKGLAAYLINDFLSSQPPPGNAHELFADEKIYFFTSFLPGNRSLKFEDVTFRLVFNVIFWVQCYCQILWPFICVANLTMLLGICEPVDWPPQFGPLSAAYTVRGAWGEFWHQQLRSHMTVNSEWIVHDILRLPRQKGHLVARYAKVLVVFAISGLIHWVPVLITPERNPQVYVMQFFITQAFGVMAEDAVQALAGPPKTARQKTAYRLVGYVWTFLFFAWSVPVWVYPNGRVPPPKPFLPYSFVQQFSGANLAAEGIIA